MFEENKLVYKSKKVKKIQANTDLFGIIFINNATKKQQQKRTNEWGIKNASNKKKQRLFID